VGCGIIILMEIKNGQSSNPACKQGCTVGVVWDINKITAALKGGGYFFLEKYVKIMYSTFSAITAKNM